VVKQHAAVRVLGDLFPGMKWPDGEVGHSPPVTDKVTIGGNFIAFSCILPHGMVINHKENFTT
jgi:hypothetical protein